MVSNDSPVNDITCSPSGRLNGSQFIYLADTSSLPWLPGTTLGLTAMAHAYRIVKRIVNRIE